MEETLSKALDSIFGEGISEDTQNENDSESPLDLLQKASDAFDKAQEELVAGNLGKYQELIERAQSLVALAIDLLNK